MPRLLSFLFFAVTITAFSRAGFCDVGHFNLQMVSVTKSACTLVTRRAGSFLPSAVIVVVNDHVDRGALSHDRHVKCLSALSA